MPSHLPAYNLKAVVHETGLTPATLRAWERRYGFFKPQRSPGGHRLYSESDIALLKWLVARQDEGLSISHAVELWRNLEKGPHGPSQQISSPRLGSSNVVMLDNLRDKWIAACLLFDEPAAEQALTQAFTIATPEVACTELLQKGLAELGDRWYGGEASVQQEHFASALAMRRLNALFAAAPLPTRPVHLLAACPPGETHDLAILMLSLILRWRGWEVIYLGANVPLVRLDQTIQSTAPGMVLSAAQTLPGAAALKDLANYVNNQGVPLAYGGGIFNQIPGLVECIPGYFLGHELSDVSQQIDRLITRFPELPAPQVVSSAYATALTGFLQKEALIIASVNAALRNSSIDPRHLEEANYHFTRAIASAIALGNIHFLDHAIDWLNRLLENYGISPTLAVQYYMAYHQAVQQHLGNQAAIILDWLAQFRTIAE
jgi:DNA-binding transcriptional MerR regulator